jgi:predicted HTH domain antitoxin
MVELKLNIPEEALLDLKMAPDRLGDELKLVAAVKLYELGKLSSGAAAALAGIPKPLFLSKLADYGVVTFRLSEEELEMDLKNACHANAE